MTPNAAASPPDAPPDHLLSRLVGVVLSPRDTFQRIVARPRWFGALALITLAVAAASFAMLSTETGQVALLDQQVRQAESFGQTISDEQYAAMERSGPIMRYFVAGSQVVFIPLVTLLLAGLLFGVFNAGLGGDASFAQMLAVVAHSGAVTLLQQVFVIPLNFARASLSSATNLGVFVQGVLEETSFLARFLGAIDLFIVWWLVVLAIGLGVLYRRRTQPIAAGLLVTYGIIAVVIAAIMSFSSGGA